jgi:hypothetical protein
MDNGCRLKGNLYKDLKCFWNQTTMTFDDCTSKLYSQFISVESSTCSMKYDGILGMAPKGTNGGPSFNESSN